MNKISRYLAVIYIFVLPSISLAQNDLRKWAVEGNIGGTFIKDKTDMHDPFNVKNGFAYYYGAEYFIPCSDFSVCMGYQGKELYLGTQSVSANLQTLNIGGRWYPAPKQWRVQPYVGLGSNILVSEENTGEGMEIVNGSKTTFSANIHSPRFMISSSVGVDCYFFSSIALYACFAYNIGINGRYDIDYSVNNRKPVHVNGNLNHCNYQIGLKVSFPFDTSIILELLDVFGI